MYVVVIVRRGVPSEVALVAKRPQALRDAKGVVQAADFSYTDDAVQVFDCEPGGTSQDGLVSNGDIEHWLNVP